MADDFDLDRKATQTGFAYLVGVSQQAVSEKVHAGVLNQGGTYRQWLQAYCERLRDEAARRGGEDAANLTKARIEESQTKSALNRITYMERIGKLVSVDDVEPVLIDWAGFANREYTNGVDKLISEIENAHKIDIDDELVLNIVGSTTGRIANHAQKLGRALAEGGDVVQAAEEGLDG